jgi:hypothetical protein
MQCALSGVIDLLLARAIGDPFDLVRPPASQQTAAASISRKEQSHA